MAVLLMLGILCISCPLALLVALAGIVIDYKRCKAYAFVLAACLAVIAYSYVPKGESDLTRYFRDMEAANSYSLGAYLAYMGDNLFVINTAFWISGRLGLPHLVPALSTFAVYGIAFYLTTDYATITGMEKNAWKVILIQFACLNFSAILNNVRNIFAFSIIILAIYFEIVKKKKKAISIPLYILACFIHESAVILVLARVAQIVLRKRIIIAAVLAALVPVVINYLFEYYRAISGYGSFGVIVSNLILTSYRAMNSTSRWATVIMTSTRHLADRYLCIAFSVFVFVKILQALRKQSDETFFQFVSLVALLTVSTNVFRTPAYWRLFSACVCCSGPILLFSMNKRVFGKNDITISIIGFGLLAGMLFSVHFFNSFAEINYIDLLSQTMMSPLVVIIFEFIVGVVRGNLL